MLANYLAFGVNGPLTLQGVSAGPELDQRLVRYSLWRLSLLDSTFHFFGEPGFDALIAAIDKAPHHRAVAMLSDRLKDPAFRSAHDVHVRTDLQLLATRSVALRPCWTLSKPYPVDM